MQTCPKLGSSQRGLRIPSSILRKHQRKCGPFLRLMLDHACTPQKEFKPATSLRRLIKLFVEAHRQLQVANAYINTFHCANWRSLVPAHYIHIFDRQSLGSTPTLAFLIIPKFSQVNMFIVVRLC